MNSILQIPAFLVVEEEAIKKIPSIIDTAFTNIDSSSKNILLVSGTYPTSIYANEIDKYLSISGYTSIKTVVSSNSINEVEKVYNAITNNNIDLVIGIGGGSVLDVTKAATFKSERPMLSVPTVTSNDGICSPVAVINFGKHTKSIGVNMPIGIVVDLNIVLSAPPRMLIAGIGDLLSNYSASYDWSLAAKRGKENYNSFADIISRNAVAGILEKERFECKNIEFLRSLTEGLVMGGVAMGIAGTSRPCSGSEHLISHALDVVSDSKAMHGEQVAIGILLMEHLQKPKIRLRRFYESLGLPTHYEQLDIKKEELKQAIKIAPQVRENRYTILNEINLSNSDIDRLIDDVFNQKRWNKVNVKANYGVSRMLSQ